MCTSSSPTRFQAGTCRMSGWTATSRQMDRWVMGDPKKRSVIWGYLHDFGNIHDSVFSSSDGQFGQWTSAILLGVPGGSRIFFLFLLGPQAMSAILCDHRLHVLPQMCFRSLVNRLPGSVGRRWDHWGKPAIAPDMAW